MIFSDASDILDWFGQRDNPSGIQRVLIEFVRSKPAGQYIRLEHDEWRTVPREALEALCEYVSGGSVERGEINRLLAIASASKPATIRAGDVVYLPGAFWGGNRGRAVLRSKAHGARVVAMFYDLIPAVRADLCSQKQVTEFVGGLQAIVPMLDAAFAISEYTASELRTYATMLGHGALPVSVHPLAHEFTAATRAEPSVRVEAISKRPFVLCVGTIETRKNQKLLIEVWRRLLADDEDRVALVLVGAVPDPALKKEILDTLQQNETLGQMIHVVTDASDTEIAALYERCLFTAYPSVLEGWGLPVGESLARGKLCVSSSASSMPEVGGDLADYCDPLSVDDVFEKIDRYIRDPELLHERTERIRREFVPRRWGEVFAGIRKGLIQIDAAVAPRPKASEGTPRVRLYGHATGEASFSQVTRGMEKALFAAGELAGVCPLEASVGDIDAVPSEGCAAPISLNCGNPRGLLLAHQAGQHRAHWLLLAPNGETLPTGFVDMLTLPSAILPSGLLTGGLLAPSAWAAGVLRRYFPALPIVVAPHGVTPEIHRMDEGARNAARASYRMGQFNVLHMTSSETERKGTKLLLSAWKQAKDEGFLPKTAKLFVIMHATQISKVKWWCSDFKITDDDVFIAPGLSYDQTNVAAMYGSMHAICQPSRGEGFGMVPLEALACGVPIIATACTGHSEYMSTPPPGAVLVEHGDIAPMDDFPGSMAPSITESAIVDSLLAAYTYWESLAAHAEQNAGALARAWSWENKNVPAIRRMLQENKEST